MLQTKRCSGCKSHKPVENFYKNRLTLDGRSNYCTDCTKVNSQKYFKRKKERETKSESENLIKMALLSSYSEIDGENAEKLMRIIVIEKMIKSINEELDELKKSYLKSESVITE